MESLTNLSRKLALSLAPSTGTTNQITYVCHSLCRAARAYHRNQELCCNGHPFGNRNPPKSWYGTQQERFKKKLETDDERLEKRIRELCFKLPTIGGRAIEPIFQGDPRGACVKLKMPDGRYDDCGREGICVPTM